MCISLPGGRVWSVSSIIRYGSRLTMHADPVIDCSKNYNYAGILQVAS